MEANKERQAAVAGIRARVQEYVGSWLGDAEAVQVALACATRDPAELLDYVASKEAARRAKAGAKALAITSAELTALFGSAATPAKGEPIAAVVATPGFRAEEAKLGAALRCTVAESGPSAAWARPCCRLACHYAMHMQRHEEALHTALGGFVRADSRRLDDVRADVEDAGPDLMLLALTIVALSESVS